MDKISKSALSVMFIIICILVTLALIDEGREREIKSLEKQILNKDVILFGVDNYHMSDNPWTGE